MSNEKHFTISSLTYFWSKIRQVIPFFHAFSNAQIDRITSTASSTSVPDFTQIAQNVIEQYEGSNLAGVDQSVKSAIDDLGQALDMTQSDVGIVGNKIGSANIANVGNSITEAIGNVALGTSATNLSGAIAQHESDISSLNNKFKHGTWIPHLYDYETFLRNLPQSNYWQIGDFVIATINVGHPNLSGISTMMQIRNVPMDVIISGTIYIANMSGNAGDHTIQTSSIGAYIRPNITSSNMSSPSTPGWVSITLFGCNYV